MQEKFYYHMYASSSTKSKNEKQLNIVLSIENIFCYASNKKVIFDVCT